MSRLALYRKYRSADLNEVVGQKHITSTLSAALKSDTISHAYLFTGPRGVGKTTVARIIARNINGLDPTDTSQQLDIIEIDAASNRGIDEIRSLREKIAVAPTNLKYKVYIIDEAHMLTKEAFNALLKTLEEPPAHVVFILATTEAHKLPETIISRTQRFDFTPHTTADITKHLAKIAKKENITIDSAAIELIAELSEGGMRDAIMLLDQLSSAETEITEKYVATQLHLISKSEQQQLLQAVSEHDQKKTLELLSNILTSATPAEVVTTQLIQSLRGQLYADSRQFDTSFIVAALQKLQNAQFQAKTTTHPNLPLEIALISLAQNDQPQNELNNVKPVKKANTKPVLETTAPSVKSNANSVQAQSHVSNTTLDNATIAAKGLSLIKEHNNSLYALLRSGNAHLRENKLLVECRFKFHKDRIEEHHNRALIEKVMTKAANREIELECNLSQPTKPKPVDKNSELVSSAMAILGGELVDE